MGVGGDVRRSKAEESKVLIIRGAPSSTRTPPFPPSFEVLPSAHVGGSETSYPGILVRHSQGWPNSYFLKPVVRRAESEGSSLTVAGSRNTNWIRKGGEVRGEHDRLCKGGWIWFRRSDIREGNGVKMEDPWSS